MSKPTQPKDGRRGLHASLVPPEFPFPDDRLEKRSGSKPAIKVSSSEFGKEVGRYQDLALLQPVVVSRNGRTVMISVEEYQRLKRRGRQVMGLNDFTDADIAALEGSRPPAEAATFNHELKP